MRGSGSRLWFWRACALVLLAIGFADVAWAGAPELADASTDTPLARWLLALAVLALPLALYAPMRERLGIARTRRDLAALARVGPEFAWQRVEAEVTLAIRALYAAWNTGDLEGVARHMSPAYFTAQRSLSLRWQSEGKRNVSELKDILSVIPLWVGTMDSSHDHTLATLVRVAQLDYLEEVESGRLIQGRRELQAGNEAVWLFAFIDGAWRVSGIQGRNQAYGFARLANRVSLSPIRAEDWGPSAIRRQGSANSAGS
jgi:hypothetical protein